MFLLSPSFTLVLMMFLGAAINSSPLFSRSFIDPEASEKTEMMDKRSRNPLLNAYGFNFGKIRGRTAQNSRSPITLQRAFTPRQDWRKWRSRSGPMKKWMLQTGLAANKNSNGLNIGRAGEVSTKNMSKRSYIPYTKASYWNPRGKGIKNLRMGALIGLGGWFLKKSNQENRIKSPASAGFGVSYGRG